MRGFWLGCVAISLAGCLARPLSPQQQHSLQMENYCSLQAAAARDGLSAQQDQSRQPVGGFYGGYAQGTALGTAYQAAYERCMMEMQARR